MEPIPFPQIFDVRIHKSKFILLYINMIFLYNSNRVIYFLILYPILFMFIPEGENCRHCFLPIRLFILFHSIIIIYCKFSRIYEKSHCFNFIEYMKRQLHFRI